PWERLLHVKKHLGFNSLIATLGKCFGQIHDPRQAGKVNHDLHDVLMSGLAMMFFQDPSLLAFQHRLQENSQQNNLSQLFGIGSIPKDSQMRDVIDSVPTEQLANIFPAFFNHLQHGRQLDPYRLLNGKYLIPIDGSEYFSSEKTCCPFCLKTKPSKGPVRYHHQILQAVIVHPDMRQVIPLFPEPIQNSDGYTKQDCETNAGKRIIA
ncbi:MAG: transposase family protein, partial [Desulfatitalea sp.]|nr:transposase family protein [Desulfatitalea sp.]